MTTEKDKASNDKTAEEISPGTILAVHLRSNHIDNQAIRHAVFDAMRDYSEQKLKEYKQKLKEVITKEDYIEFGWNIPISEILKLIDKTDSTK